MKLIMKFKISIVLLLMPAIHGMENTDQIGLALKNNDFKTYFALIDSVDEDSRELLYQQYHYELKNALGWAASHNNVEALKELYKRGVHKKNSSQVSALHVAAHTNAAEAVQFLIKEGANINQLDAAFRSTPLHWAVDRNALKAIECLLQAGANLDIRDSIGATPLIRALNNSTIDCSIIKMLLKAGSNIILEDNFGRQAIHHAACNNHGVGLQYLIQAGANVDAKNPAGATPLHNAASSGALEAVKVLLAAKASLKATDVRGLTALHWAVYSPQAKSAPLIRYLVEQGADIEARTTNDRTPLRIADENGNLRAIGCLIELGADAYAGSPPPIDGRNSAYLRQLLRFLDTKSPNVKREKGMTLLMEAGWDGYVDIVEGLLHDDRLNPNIQDRQGNTALHLAASKGHTAIVELLLRDNRMNKYVQNCYGYTAFHVAVHAHAKKIEMVASFILNDTSVMEPMDNEGRSVKALAQLHPVIKAEFIRICALKEMLTSPQVFFSRLPAELRKKLLEFIQNGRMLAQPK